MGAGVSLADERELFLRVQRELDQALLLNDASGPKDEEDMEDGDQEEEEKDLHDVTSSRSRSGDSVSESARKCDLVLYDKVKSVVSSWSTKMYNKYDVIHCDLLDIDDAIAAAFESGKTPLVLDTSPDDKVSTYFSYQPDAVILEAKSLIIDSAKRPLLEVMDGARARLVGAMKHGKTLVIRMGTSAPDFRSTLCDAGLIAKNLIDPYVVDVQPATETATEPATEAQTEAQVGVAAKVSVPVTAFENNSDSSNPAPIVSESSDKVGGVSTGVGGNSASEKSIENLYNEDEEEDDDGEEDDEETASARRSEQRHQRLNSLKEAKLSPAYFPSELFISGGSVLKQPLGHWPERLFREEDMKPHKNFAYVRDEFRVMLVSQLPLEAVDACLFSTRWGGLPDKSLFKLVCIDYPSEENEKGDEEQRGKDDEEEEAD